MSDLGAEIWGGFVGMVENLLTGFIEIVKKIVEAGIEIILYTPVPKRCVEGATQPYPDCTTVVALVQKPANGPWPSVFETAWTKVFPTAVTVLFILYLVLRVVETIPAISRKKTHHARTNIFGALVMLPFSWSFGAGILVFFDGLSQALAPNPGEFGDIITAQLTALLTAAASPGGNVVALGISSVDGAVIAGALLAYLFRILFLLFVMQYIHLFAVIYLLDVPVLKGIVTKIFETFIAMAFLPLLVSGMFDFATTLFSSDTTLPVLGGLGDFVIAIISMVLPLASLALYYLALKGAMLSGMSTALGKVESAASGTTVGELGEASSDEYGGFIEEKATQLEERVQQGTQTTASFSKRGAMAAGRKSAFAARHPKQAGGKTKAAAKNTPGKVRDVARSGADSALAAYENVPSSASEAMKTLGVRSRDIDDVDRRELGQFGHRGDESRNVAGTLSRGDAANDEYGLSVKRTFGSVEKATQKSVASLVDDGESDQPADERAGDGVDAMSDEEIEEFFDEPDEPDAAGIDAAERATASTAGGESDTSSRSERREQGGSTALNKETFDRAVEESNLSREGIQVLLQSIKDKQGEEAVRQKVRDASYMQLARESGRKQAAEARQRMQLKRDRVL